MKEGNLFFSFGANKNCITEGVLNFSFNSLSYQNFVFFALQFYILHNFDNKLLFFCAMLLHAQAEE
jgi:hypothetical protein